MTRLEKLTTKWFEYQQLNDELWDFLQDDVMKLSLDDIPFDDCGWDWYDNSLEIYGCRDEFEFTPEQLSKIWEYGFTRIFVNCPSQGKYYRKGFDSYGKCSTRPKRDNAKQLKYLRIENEELKANVASISRESDKDYVNFDEFKKGI